MTKSEKHVTDQAAVLEAIRNSPGPKVKVAVCDIDGVLRGKYIYKDKFFSAVESGFGFCDVVFGWDMTDEPYDNTQVTGWHKGDTRYDFFAEPAQPVDQDPSDEMPRLD
jgi:hypothetical protein